MAVVSSDSSIYSLLRSLLSPGWWTYKKPAQPVPTTGAGSSGSGQVVLPPRWIDALKGWREGARALIQRLGRRLAAAPLPSALDAAYGVVTIAASATAVAAVAAWRKRQRRLLEEGLRRDRSNRRAAFNSVLPEVVQERRARPEGERLVEPGGGRVWQIVLTGGPRGGKKSLATRLAAALREELQLTVLVAPEVAPMLINSGCQVPSVADPLALLQFETAVTQLQMQLESSLMRIGVSTGQRVAIIYGRGVLDVAAFLPREQWPALAAMSGAPSRPMDWYSSIVHLVTVADGLHSRPSFGQTREDEAALRLDALMQEVQSGHPNYVRIDNSTGFEQKLQRAVDAVVAQLRQQGA